MVLAINPSAHQLSTQWPPWNFYKPYFATPPLTVRVEGGQCAPMRPAPRAAADSCCAHVVSCRLTAAPGKAISITMSHRGKSKSLRIALVEQHFRGVYQHCVGTPIYKVAKQIPYLLRLRQSWGLNRVKWSYLFARDQQGCDMVQQAYPRAHCSVRSRTFSNATMPQYDKVILQQLCLLYARHSKARFLVLTDLDELPPPRFETFLTTQWRSARFARNTSTGGFLIFFDAAMSCPKHVGCPTNYKHYRTACASEVIRNFWKPVVIPSRVEYVDLHNFAPLAGSARPHVWQPCLQHLRTHKCWLKDGVQKCEAD